MTDDAKFHLDVGAVLTTHTVSGKSDLVITDKDCQIWIKTPMRTYRIVSDSACGFDLKRADLVGENSARGCRFVIESGILIESLFDIGAASQLPLYTN
jgi:hypothetical protein